MSEVVASGIIEARRLRAFAKVYHARPAGVDVPFVEEVKVHFNDDGFHVNVCDASNVALIRPSHLSADAFEHYDAPGSVTIGVNLSKLIDFLNPASPDDLVEFAVDMETRKLQLHYGGGGLNMSLIDPDAIRQEPDLPDLDLPNWFILSGEQLADALEIINLVSSHVVVSVDAENREVSFTGEGDIDDGFTTYSKGDLQDSNLVETAESKFSLDYLRTLAAPIPNDAEVTIDVGDEFPMQLQWRGVEDHLAVNETLAPRIQSR